MTNYQDGKIYEIVCNITGNRYIGSTVQTLDHRLSQHKKSNCSSTEIIDNRDYCINLLEAYPCNSDTELRIKEREWYDKLECINKRQPYRSSQEKKEYYIDNARIKEQNKKYRIVNANILLEYNKQYYIDNKDKMKKQHQEYGKQYYIDNAAKLKEQRRQRYLKQKETANAL